MNSKNVCYLMINKHREYAINLAITNNFETKESKNFFLEFGSHKGESANFFANL